MPTSDSGSAAGASASVSRDPLNEHVAALLEETAALLEAQQANAFRVQAYRRAADTVRGLGTGVDDILDAEGQAGLDRLAGIGATLARVIDQIVTTGRFPMLERLRAGYHPVAELMSVPGIGATLARRLRDERGITTLEQLEIAAHDGTLEKVTGFGPKRVDAIRDVLATRLGRHVARAPMLGERAMANEPTVAELLDIDREYRDGSDAGALPRIAPRRFNPTGEKWLPVLHATRGATQYTALYSNTALAHDRKKTHDWVVVYFKTNGEEHQRTIVTEPSGPLRGRRVVRGREAECRRYYGLYRQPNARGVARALRRSGPIALHQGFADRNLYE